ncbi:MDR family MFS transporter [Actinoplanes sp. NPDC049316]|uniref:MDR family MFS transporter n=1 Tax=Actinoplanes sp. NPDC049316 TaxID=3154727 RepID=UPI003426F06D
MTRPSHEPSTAPTGPLGHDLRFVLAALMLNTFMSMLDQSIVATAGPTVVGELGGLDHYAWVFTGYMLAFSVTMPIYGKLGDLFGRKPVHLLAITIFLTGSVAAGLAQSMGQLIAFRVLQGLGGGGLVVLGMGSLGDLLEPRQRAKYQGYFAVVFTLANLCGPLAGGLITDQLGWRWVFFVNVPIGLATMALLMRFLHPGRAPERRPRIDYAGALTLAAAIVGALLVSTWGGNDYAWTSPTIVSLTAATVALLLAWLWIERTAAEPLIPLRLFGDRTFSIMTVIAFAGSFAFFGCINFVPLFLQLVSGASPTATGLLYLPAMVCVAVASVVSGRLIARSGHYKWVVVASMGIAAAGTILLSTVGGSTPGLLVAGFLAVVGLGIGLSQQVTTLAAQNAAPPQDMGVATSTVGFLRNLGFSFGVAVFGAVLNARLAAELPAALGADRENLTPETVSALPPAVRGAVAEAYGSSLATVFRWAVPVLLVGFVLALWLQDVQLRRRGPGGPGGPGGPRSQAGAAGAGGAAAAGPAPATTG